MNTREQKLEAFGRLLDILDELREKCPWDRKQTNESLRPQTIEEVYELSDAILKDEHAEICKELGDLLCVKAPTVTVMIKRMERLGMIERKHDENDQRIYRIYLTARGRKIAERVKRMVMQMEQELLQLISY